MIEKLKRIINSLYIKIQYKSISFQMDKFKKKYTKG